LSVTYTNRKGVTYTLFHPTTKIGEPLDEIHAGWCVSPALPNSCCNNVRFQWTRALPGAR